MRSLAIGNFTFILKWEKYNADQVKFLVAVKTHISKERIPILLELTRI